MPTTYRLMNSAMMPAFGKYHYAELTANEFGEIIQRANEAGALKSYIGYQQNADIIFQLSRVRVEINTEQTELNNGDILLCMTLKYRLARINVQDRQIKGRPINTDNFKYGMATYIL